MARAKGAGGATAQRREAERALMTLAVELQELERLQWVRRHEPPGWRGIEDEHPTRPKRVKLTLLLDAPVARWFRAQGEGYQARVNAVLRAYMAARLADPARETLLASDGR